MSAPMSLTTGSTSLVIARSPAEVWGAVADITRMGEWSPECTAGRWVAPATGPAMGAEFEGDNVAKVLGRTVKEWTTTSLVTACEAGSVFEFRAADYTTWRYAFEAAGEGTKVTESFSFKPQGVMGFVYKYLLGRRRMMIKGMQATLARVKQALEA